MRRKIRRSLTVVVILFVGIGLVGCLEEGAGDDAVFACEGDDDCASGFDCLERPDGQQVCAEEPFDDPETPDDCEPGENEIADVEDGECVYQCESGYSDCDTDVVGCEAEVDDCADLCEPGENETADVENGDCVFQCEPGYSNCDYDVDGCESEVDDCAELCEPGTNEYAEFEDGGCIFSCEDGYTDCYDAIDGCESAADNCEHMVESALYVSEQEGDDNNEGTPSSPLGTLDTAIAATLPDDDLSQIRLAEGTYESETRIPAGIDIVGGLRESEGWVPGDGLSTIEDGGTVDDGIFTTLLVGGSEFDTEDPFEIRGIEVMPPEATPEQPSVATVRVHDAELTFDDVAVNVGTAGRGEDGVDGASSGEVGEDADGDEGEPYNDQWQSNVDTNRGGVGGEGIECAFSEDSPGGGKGGESIDPSTTAGQQGHGQPGDDGDSVIAGEIGGSGGARGDGVTSDLESENITDGEDGGSGDPGGHGAPAELSSVDHPFGEFDQNEFRWERPVMEYGEPGRPGDGGGGGGGGGGIQQTDTKLGSAGGGGGAGGCGGDVGEPGEVGGSVFGLVVFGGNITVGEVSVEVIPEGGGGAGGDGGDGACGVEGGSGGEGGSSDDSSSNLGGGGDGGDGGTGGNGAPGVGGHGGSVVGVAVVGGVQWDENDNDGEITYDIPEDAYGSGGKAGAAADADDDCPQSGGSTAEDGENGEVFDFFVFD